ncbi:M48 family metallopeptidase [Acidovorax sp. 106]|uniref:M48 family metallopeptidase n=1 Tax=Acidovorax sp. 106 TaxID=2135637 RepID=UPI000EAD0BC4|nr:SprT family zinc-dependent metalloprotease [Acidovorax sp. 106]RLJ38444.1 hypothetical protein C8C98_2172 [Acidovorax sp. 106]
MERLVQLALDLFDPQGVQRSVAPAPGGAPVPASTLAKAPGGRTPPARPGRQRAAPVPQGLKQKRPPAPIDKALAAPEIIAIQPLRSAPPAPIASLLPPTEFRHPQANREVLLGDALVAYSLHRSRRSTIGFTVGADGLAVRAPTWVALSAVDGVLRERSAWVMTKLVQARERQQRLEGGRICWANGVVLPYMGHPLQVVLDPTQTRSGRGGALVAAEPALSPTPADAAQPPEALATDTPAQLFIGLPADASVAQIRDAVLAWLMRDARRHFIERLDHFAPLLGVQWTSLRLSSAETRWGSAKADGSIRLNWRLVHYRPAVIDYVVAHELAHLRVMDHSPRFWNTVATVVPDYAALRNHLREEPAPLLD